jgi:DNA repair photolyase
MSKLIKAKENIYDWVTHLWNPIRGCPHQCSYCYVKKMIGQPKELTLLLPFPKLREDKTIFVGHLTDIFANEVPSEWIKSISMQCISYSENKYVFQTKNPKRAIYFINRMGLPRMLVGTTIETNRKLYDGFSSAPSVEERATAMATLKAKKFVTIEPIIDFDLEPMLELIKIANPDFVNIGADSKKNNLPEPSKDKILALIHGIKYIGIKLKIKQNLERLIK